MNNTSIEPKQTKTNEGMIIDNKPEYPSIQWATPDPPLGPLGPPLPIFLFFLYR